MVKSYYESRTKLNYILHMLRESKRQLNHAHIAIVIWGGWEREGGWRSGIEGMDGGLVE